jgi:hypothetical protein
MVWQAPARLLIEIAGAAEDFLMTADAGIPPLPVAAACAESLKATWFSTLKCAACSLSR